MPPMPPDVIIDPRTRTYYSPSTGHYYSAAGLDLSAATPHVASSGAGQLPTTGLPPTKQIGDQTFVYLDDPDYPSTGLGKWIAVPTKGANPSQLVNVGGVYKLIDPTNGQVISELGPAGSPSVGSSLTPNTVYSEQAQNARDAAARDEQAREYNETFGYNKARGDQTQQLAEGNVLGSFRGQPTLGAQQLGLDRDKFGFDQFKYLSDLKANPRNFMQTFNIVRGFNAPPGSADFGTNGNLPGYGNTPGGYAMPRFGAPTSAPQTNYAVPRGAMAEAQPQEPQQASAYNPATDPNRGTRFEGLSGFNTDGTLRLAPNDPDAAGLMAAHPGQYRIGFAHGGIVPEPVVGVGLHSGKRYEFGERGPEGVVPASYLPKFLAKRHGRAGAYALGGEIGFDPGTTDPFNTDPNPTQTTADPNTDTSPYTVVPFTGNVYNASNAPLPIPGVVGPDTTTLDASAAGHDNVYQTPTPTSLDPNAQPKTGASPLPFNITGNTPPPGFHWQNGVLVQDATVAPPPPPPPHPPTPPVQQPIQQPQGGGIVSPPASIGSVSPRDVAPAGTFGSPIGGRDSLSTFRSYLPQFLAGEDTPLANLVGQGIVPPWLGRIFAQEHGATEFGTNTPQRFNLPDGVPLISHLAYLQMSPSERQAFSSYISSYGIEPNDYFDYVNSVSPQGPSSQSPTFGTPFAPNIAQE